MKMQSEQIFPVRFVVPERGVYKLVDISSADPDRDWEFFTRSELAWIVQTYLRLKAIGAPISVSDIPSVGAINIMHVDEMLKLKRAHRYFSVCVLADRKVYKYGNINIVQNKEQLAIPGAIWVPHWPQPGLLPSGRSKNSAELNVAFMGLPENSIDLEKKLNGFSGGYKIVPMMLGPGKWNDYSDVDVAIGIRDFQGCLHTNKPATKLVNAWLAKVPFIGGVDSAYEQIGRPSIDYLKVKSEDELLSALNHLSNDPAYRLRLVEEGSKSVQRYTFSSVCQHWNKLILGVAQKKYKAWKASTHLRRSTYSLRADLVYNLLRTKRYLKRRVY